ncbi:hypothetical protein Vadar_034644 [Vaccinium darrowii]|uniref:Uncharacterized protein n=1 Tax=Vaccinium darrowii TaxID=229202 RepID=A0ACB7ZNH5_9ERIC|nr:hypothetical protein Vadar_034644 [Vaccinium darrowii]
MYVSREEEEEEEKEEEEEEAQGRKTKRTLRNRDTHTFLATKMKWVKPKISRQPVDLSTVRRNLSTIGEAKGLPIHFCEKHRRSHDEFIALLDEDGNKSPTNRCLDGAALVFQLIKLTMFKVYIMRVNDKDEENDEVPMLRTLKRVPKGLEQCFAGYILTQNVAPILQALKLFFVPLCFCVQIVELGHLILRGKERGLCDPIH